MRKNKKQIDHFWDFGTAIITNEAGEEIERRTLTLDGPIASESWWGDEVTPEAFRSELNAKKGPIDVWINSGGGDCIAAAQIYNMLKEYSDPVTVKIDGIAASAASVIAMAGDTVEISPVGLIMIHNPSTIAWGDEREMEKTKNTLAEVKESIINAYEIKTGLDREELANLMDAETWMNARAAKDKGFVDSIIGVEDEGKIKNAIYSTGQYRLVENRIEEPAEELGTKQVKELRAQLLDRRAKF